jgi:hypothetical protein
MTFQDIIALAIFFTSGGFCAGIGWRIADWFGGRFSAEARAERERAALIDKIKKRRAAEFAQRKAQTRQTNGD